MKGKRIGILGGGKSGVYAALLALHKGFSPFLSEKNVISSKFKQILIEKGVEFEEGKHTIEKLLECDIIVKSPGISPREEIIRALKGKEIIGECEWAYRFCKSRIVAITGTIGKSTMTRLIHEVLMRGGFRSVPTGNYEFGPSFSQAIIEYPDMDWYVVEMSSFQLEDITTFCPDVAVLLNIYPNHTERYVTIHDYIMAKMRITRNQKEDNVFIINRGNSYLRDFVFETQARVIEIYDDEDEIPLSKLFSEVALRFASIVGIESFIVKSVLQSMEMIKVPFRIELVGEINGVKIYNDSKSTLPYSTYHSILNVGGSSVVLIMGGKSSPGFHYSILNPVLKKYVKYLVITGQNANEIRKHVEGHVRLDIAGNLEEAVNYALRNASPGDVLLFSPGAKSFDSYSSYIERGLHFNRIIREIAKREHESGDVSCG